MAIVWIFSGLLAAALGGAIWAIIGHTTGYEIGWVAIGLGALVGFAVASAAGKRAGILTAVASSVLALAGVLVGQLGTLWLDVDSELRAIRATRISDDVATSFIADDIAEQRAAAGIDVQWPDPLDDTDPAASYPADVWHDAQNQWAAMTASEREQFRDDIAESAASEIRNIDVGAYLLGGLDVKSILFYAIAVAAAFRLGFGRSSAPVIKSNQATKPPEPGSWLTRLTPANTAKPGAAVPAAGAGVVAPGAASQEAAKDGRPPARGLPDIPAATGDQALPARAPKPGSSLPAEGGVFRPDRLAS